MPPVDRSQRILAATLIVVVGLVGAAVVASLGPNEAIVCGTGHLVNRLAQAVSRRLGGGVIDGPSGSFCTVPADASWLLAAGVLLAFVVVAGLVLRRPARRAAAP